MPTRDELLAALDEHDRLIRLCVRQRLGVREFLAQYDSFFMRWALDGHESSPAEQRILSEHAARIRVHRRVWDEVETQVTSDEHAASPDVRAHGFIGSDEALQRLIAIAIEGRLVEVEELG